MENRRHTEPTLVFVILAIALLLFLGVDRVKGAPIYTVTAVTVPGAGESMVMGINSAGAAAGYAVNAGQRTVAAAATGDGFSYLPLPAGATESKARSINDRGVVVGTSYSGGAAQATLWDAGGATRIGSLGGGDSYGTGVNNLGAVVGGSATSGGQARAFLYEAGEWTDIGADWAGGWSVAYDVSDSGQVAGYGQLPGGCFRGFTWNADEGMTVMGTLGGPNSYALAINSAGQAAGHAQLRGGAMHAVLWDGDVIGDLGTLGGGSSFAYDLNDWGDIVGYSWLAAGGGAHAFLFTGGVMLDLNSLLLPDSGWVLQEAYAINNAGQIGGVGLYNGQRTGFRLDPLATALSFRAADVPTVHNPEPGTITLFALGLGLIGLGIWRRKR